MLETRSTAAIDIDQSLAERRVSQAVHIDRRVRPVATIDDHVVTEGYEAGEQGISNDRMRCGPAKSDRVSPGTSKWMCWWPRTPRLDRTGTKEIVEGAGGIHWRPQTGAAGEREAGIPCARDDLRSRKVTPVVCRDERGIVGHTDNDGV